MDKQEIYRIASNELTGLKELTFSELSLLVGSKTEKEIHGKENILYSIEVEYFWNNDAHDSMKIVCRVSDHNWHKFERIEETIIISKD